MKLTKVDYDPFAPDPPGKLTKVDYNPFAPDYEPPSQLRKDLGRGVDMLQKNLYSSAELAGSATGFKPLRQFGESGRLRNQAEIEANPALVGGVEDINSFSKLGQYAKGMIAEQIPNIGTTMTGAGAGALAGSVIPGIGTTLGAIGGGLAATYPQLAGEYYSEQREQGVDNPGLAAISALPATALEAAPLGRAAGRVLGMVGKSGDGLLKRMAKGAGESAVSEGITEGLQEELGIQQRASYDPNYGRTGAEANSRRMNAVAGGTLVGGVFGGVSPGRYQAPPNDPPPVEERPILGQPQPTVREQPVAPEQIPPEQPAQGQPPIKRKGSLGRAGDVARAKQMEREIATPIQPPLSPPVDVPVDMPQENTSIPVNDPGMGPEVVSGGIPVSEVPITPTKEYPSDIPPAVMAQATQKAADLTQETGVEHFVDTSPDAPGVATVTNSDGETVEEFGGESVPAPEIVRSLGSEKRAKRYAEKLSIETGQQHDVIVHPQDESKFAVINMDTADEYSVPDNVDPTDYGYQQDYEPLETPDTPDMFAVDSEVAKTPEPKSKDPFDKYSKEYLDKISDAAFDTEHGAQAFRKQLITDHGFASDQVNINPPKNEHGKFRVSIRRTAMKAAKPLEVLKAERAKAAEDVTTNVDAIKSTQRNKPPTAADGIVATGKPDVKITVPPLSEIATKPIDPQEGNKVPANMHGISPDIKTAPIKVPPLNEIAPKLVAQERGPVRDAARAEQNKALQNIKVAPVAKQPEVAKAPSGEAVTTVTQTAENKPTEPVSQNSGEKAPSVPTISKPNGKNGKNKTATKSDQLRNKAETVSTVGLVTPPYAQIIANGGINTKEPLLNDLLVQMAREKKNLRPGFITKNGLSMDRMRELLNQHGLDPTLTDSSELETLQDFYDYIEKSVSRGDTSENKMYQRVIDEHQETIDAHEEDTYGRALDNYQRPVEVLDAVDEKILVDMHGFEPDALHRFIEKTKADIAEYGESDDPFSPKPQARKKDIEKQEFKTKPKARRALKTAGHNGEVVGKRGKYRVKIEKATVDTTKKRKPERKKSNEGAYNESTSTLKPSNSANSDVKGTVSETSPTKDITEQVFPSKLKARRAIKAAGINGGVVGEPGKYRIELEKPAESVAVDPAAGTKETVADDSKDAKGIKKTSRKKQHLDVGEKIGGAKKDRWAVRGLKVADLQGMTNAEAHEYVTKDQVWPKPDYRKLVADGIDPVAVRIIKHIRDRSPMRPAKDDSESRKYYVETLAMIRESVEERGDTASLGISYLFIGFGPKEKALMDRAFSYKLSRIFPSSWDVAKYQVEIKNTGWPNAKKTVKKGTGDGLELPKRPHLDNQERRGANWRKGKDISGDDLRNVFGFRGVEYGNYVADDERQKSLNLAFDSLHDLADILNIPPEAVSLDGRLGLAFGARGGGSAAAHYESHKLVINLTKLRGGGTLAHEWAHALDHYFGEKNVEKGSAGNANFASGGRGSYSRRGILNLRPALQDAFDGTMDAIFKRRKTKADVVRKLELDIESLEASIARTEGYLVKYKGDKGYKKNLREWQQWLDRWGHPVLKKHQKNLAEARTDSYEPTEKTRSSFLTEAVKLSGGKSGYWQRPTEMFARAMEAYAFDRIKDRGNQSDYLVQGAEENRYAVGFRGNPYPVGLERETINKAFDKFFETVRVKTNEETGRPSILESRADKPVEGRTADRIQRVVDSFQAKYKGAQALDIKVVQSVTDLPYKATGLVEGAIVNDTIYLVADNLQNPKRAKQVLLHEAVGHYGLSAMMGKEFNPLMDLVSNTFPEDVKVLGRKYQFELDTVEGLRRAAEEVIAQYAESSPESSFTMRVVARIKRWLRRMGFRLKLTQGEIVALLANTKSRLKKGNLQRSKYDVDGPIEGLWQKPPVNVVSVPDAPLKHRDAQNILDGYHNQTVINKDTGWKIIFSRKGLEKSGRFKRTKENPPKIVRELPKLLKEAVLVHSEYTDKPQEKMSMRFYRKFYVPIHMGGKYYKVKLVVREHYDRDRYYSFSLYNLPTPIPIKNGSGKDSTQAPHSDGMKPKGLRGQPQNLPFPNIKIGDLLAGVNISQRSLQIRDSVDPSKDNIRESLKDDLRQNLTDTYEALKTVVTSPASKDVGFFESLMASPEWNQHPVIKKIVDIAIKRGDMFHRRFEKFDTNEAGERVGQKINDLARKGVGRIAFMRGKRSKEYGQLQDILSWADEKKWKKDLTPEEIEQTTVAQMKSRGYSPDTIKVWTDMRGSFDKALDELIKPMKEFKDRIDQEAKKKGAKPEYPQIADMTLDQVIAQMGSLRGHYSPRKRDGDWVIQGTDAQGNHYREHAKGKIEANSRKIKLTREGYTIAPITKVEKQPEEVFQTLKTAAAEQIVRQAAGNMNAKDDVKRVMIENMLVETADLIKGRGFRSSMIKRGKSVVKGFEEDPQERYLRYITGTAGGIAKSEAARAMVVEMQNIEASKQPKAYEYANTYVKEQLRNTDNADLWTAKLKSLATFKYLGFSPRSALVNMTALVTTAPPAIRQYATGGKASFREVAREMGRAMKLYGQYMAGKNPDLKPDEQKFLDKLKEDGYDVPQHTRDAIGHLQDAYGQTWTKTMAGAMYMFQKTEMFNRGSTLLAGYRLARKHGQSHDEATESARTASDRAHGIYGKETLPIWAQGSDPAKRIAQFTYVFQKFGHNYVQMLYDLGVRRRDIKSFAYALAAPVALGGAASIPFKDNIVDMISAILSALGDDRDPEKLAMDMIREEFGPETETDIRYGLISAVPRMFGLPGINLAGSLSVGVGIPRNAYELAGAPGGVIKDAFTAYDAYIAGNKTEAVARLLPSAIGNIGRSVKEANYGATTRDNRPVWDETGKQYQPTTGESVAKALSFTKSDRSALGTRRWESKREKAAFAETRGRIYDQYRAYATSGRKDKTEYQEIIDSIKTYNENAHESRLPIPIITSKTLRRLMRRASRPGKMELAMVQ